MGDITLGKEHLDLMAKSGCVGIKFGVETSNSITLREIGKGFVELEKVRKLVDECRKIGIRTHATFMIGLPGEKRVDILNTIKFAMKLKPDSMQFSIATPFPGTPFFSLVESEGWLTTIDWTLFDGAHRSVISYPGLSNKEIEELYQLALDEYKSLELSRRRISMESFTRTLRTKGALYGIKRGAKILYTKVGMKLK
jgi:radical SAM superfamily enzyme YgiQ (UPF0313 family)